MKKIFFLLCVAGLLLVSQTVSADLISGSSSGDWRTWETAVLNENNIPYWDGKSSDGAKKNIGFYLTKTGAFASSPAYEHPETISYWGTDTGGFDLDFYFVKDSAYSNAALRLEIAGYRDFNEFGWYDWTSGERNLIFDGSDSLGDDSTFTPSATYGFYMENKLGEVFLTEAGAWGSRDSDFQHFAVFLQSPNTYWIGIEDLLRGGDKDYNDMVIKVTPARVPVPESATMLLLGMGLIGLAGLKRKFKR